MRKNILKNKNGSALMIAIVIMMLVMVFSVTLLSVSYSTFYSSTKQKKAEQCKELARTVSREIQGEITGFTESELIDMRDALTNDVNGLKTKYPLWFYLRENLWQESWPYLDPMGVERGHSSAYADRYFKLKSNGVESQILDGISVRMYWEKASETEIKTETKIIRQAYLTIDVTCELNDQKSTIKTIYNVVASEEKPIGGDASGTSEPGNVNEMWDITYAWRE